MVKFLNGPEPKNKTDLFNTFKSIVNNGLDEPALQKIASDSFHSKTQELLILATGKKDVENLHPNRQAKYTKLKEMLEGKSIQKITYQDIAEYLDGLSNDYDTIDENGNTLVHLILKGLNRVSDASQQSMVLNKLISQGEASLLLKMKNNAGVTALDMLPESNSWKTALLYTEIKSVRDKVKAVLSYISTNYNNNQEAVANKAIEDLKVSGGTNGFFNTMISEVTAFQTTNKNSWTKDKIYRIDNNKGEESLYEKIFKYYEKMEIKVY